MPERKPTPFLKGAEVRAKEAEGDPKLAEVLSSEEMMYDYFVETEGRYSILDEMVEVLSEYKDQDGRGYSISRCQSEITRDARAFVEILTDAVVSRIEKEFEKANNISLQNCQDKSVLRDLCILANARTFVMEEKIVLLKELIESRSRFLPSQMDKDKLQAYREYVADSKTRMDAVRSDLQIIGEGVDTVNADKRATRKMLTPEERASMYGVEVKKVVETGNSFATSLARRLDKTREKMGLPPAAIPTFVTAGLEGNVDNKFHDAYNRHNIGLTTDFFTAYATYRDEMIQLREMLHSGKIVETPYIKKIMAEAEEILKRRNPPGVVFFHGDFGTGKTALAIHLAKKMVPDKEPIMVAGNKYLETGSLTEELRVRKGNLVTQLNYLLKLRGQSERISPQDNEAEILSKFIGEKNELINKHARLIAENDYRCEKKEQKGEFDQNECNEYVESRAMKGASAWEQARSDVDRLFDNPVQGVFVLGDMYQAMNTGTPLIIDEANALSPEIMISLNDAFTWKRGEKHQVKSAEDYVEVKDGYCLIMTGNTGKRYVKGRDLSVDPATYSRIYPIHFRYLPQTISENVPENLKRLDLQKLANEVKDESGLQELLKTSKECAETDQIFQVLLIKLLNRRMGTYLETDASNRYEAIFDLYRLCVGAKIIMTLFEEDNVDGLNVRIQPVTGFPDTCTDYSKCLRHTNLTMRGLIDDIIGQYLAHGCSLDLSYFAFNFVRKYNLFPKEQAILYAVLQKVGLFTSSVNVSSPGDNEGLWPNVSLMRNEREFVNKISNFNPLDKDKGIKKYRKFSKNGTYAALMPAFDEKSNPIRRVVYINSIEAMQLLYGLLPPRQLPEYQSISESVLIKREAAKTALNKEEAEKRGQKLIKRVARVQRSLGSNHFIDKADFDVYSSEIKATKIFDKQHRDSLSDDELCAVIEIYVDIILKFQRKKKQDNPSAVKAIDEAAKSSLEEKIDLAENLLQDKI